MKINFISIILIGILFFPAFAKAQQNQETISQNRVSDSLKQQTALAIKEKFPRTRILNFEYGQSLSRDFESELFEEAFQEGEIKTQRNFIASANVPFYSSKNRKLSLTASGSYQFTEFEFDGIENMSATNVFEQNGIVNFHNFSTALSGTYFSKLFGKTVIFNASIIADGNDDGFERIKGLAGLSFILKRTERTTITLGAIVFVDPTAQIPFAPTFSYNHRFKNSKWELDFILPQRLLLRRPIGNNSRLSVGSTFGSTGFYVNVSDPNFAEVYEYSQLEINSGFIFEHRFNDYLIGTLRGGVQHFLSNRLTEKAEPNSEFIYSNEQDATGYFQVGMSIDPFSAFKKKQ